MSHLVYFSSVSENTHRFVTKLGLPAEQVTRIPLHERIEVDEPYVLVVPTYGGGKATPLSHRSLLKSYSVALCSTNCSSPSRWSWSRRWRRWYQT